MGSKSKFEFHTIISPESFLTVPEIILINVDFPAPFGPKSPNIQPSGIDKFTEFNASCFFLVFGTKYSLLDF